MLRVVPGMGPCAAITILPCLVNSAVGMHRGSLRFPPFGCWGSRASIASSTVITEVGLLRTFVVGQRDTSRRDHAQSPLLAQSQSLGLHGILAKV